ncbi:MAG: phage head closure protein [Bdellovibrionales bacterium]
MAIGTLRKKVSIQTESKTPDNAGGYTLAWTTLATVWANITPISGKEVFAAGHLEGRATHKVTIRWRGDIALTPDMRLSYNSRAFNIRAVLNKGEENKHFLLYVEEGGAS